MPDPGSATPQLRKLGVVPGARWSVVGADPAWAFELAAQLDANEQRIFAAGALWTVWPHRAAGHVSELGDTLVRETGLAREQLVDTKSAALDHDGRR